MTRVRSVTTFLVCACLSWAAPARGDAVTYWNNVTVTAVTAGRPGPVGYLDIALVQAAVHDAVQALEKKFEPYYAVIEGASGSPEAAVAGAAYGLLLKLYPAQQGYLQGQYDDFLAASGLAGDPGLTVGQQAADVLFTQYRPAVTLPPFVGGTDVGEWRPTPSFIGTPPVPAPFSPMAFLYLVDTTPFTLNRPSQFRPGPPPPLKSTHYLRDYNEVKALGHRFSSTRTAAQTDLAYFWSENFTAQWNRALRAIVDARPMDTGDSARLFALANLATADALITCWDSKYHFNFWRPLTAIQEGDNDGNARTVGDPAWEPLVNTPNYPDYTSGANNVTAAMTTTLAQFFGTDVFDFSVTSNSPLAIQKTRTFSRFSDAAQEVVEARILLGIHFRFADELARNQGSHVAHWAFHRFLRPVPPGHRQD